jgi:hypothetical protein
MISISMCVLSIVRLTFERGDELENTIHIFMVLCDSSFILFLV